ncbi:MAG: TerB family tellurite resistance protein [Acidobacteria bacterium]|nr:MAG: TerB family tellurite resistance protein [Acidobacteriota bacterium]
MGLLERLGLGGRARDPDETETVRRIARELEKLPPERARFVAAFAYVLGRVARADRKVTEDEIARMTDLVARVGGLPGSQAALAVEIARVQGELFAGTEDFLVTRQLRDLAGAEDKRRLLACLFAVAAADGTVTTDEEAVVREIAEELGLTHRDYVAARAIYRDQRAVLRGFPREGGPVRGDSRGEGTPD